MASPAAVSDRLDGVSARRADAGSPTALGSRAGRVVLAIVGWGYLPRVVNAMLFPCRCGMCIPSAGTVGIMLARHAGAVVLRLVVG